MSDPDRDGPAPARRVPCAGGIVRTGRAGERLLLLIRRGQPPAQGAWSVPGGRCRPGEPTERCCVREVREETGLDVRVVRLAGTVERDAPDGGIYVIDDYVCELTGGELRAGDDAADACWADRATLLALRLSPGLLDALTEWDVLPD